jgi:NMD protein affecting ribosome stability and mRNA decay
MHNERFPEGTCQQCGKPLNPKDAEDGLCVSCIVENER